MRWVFVYLCMVWPLDVPTPRWDAEGNFVQDGVCDGPIECTYGHYVEEPQPDWATMVAYRRWVPL